MTQAGVKAGAAESSDEMRETLARLGREMEKAFIIAARNIQEAFETAKKNVQKNMVKEVIVCSNCGEKNPAYASYCYKCGNKLKPEAAATATAASADKQEEATNP
jgi:ribosomal protein L40E